MKTAIYPRKFQIGSPEIIIVIVLIIKQEGFTMHITSPKDAHVIGNIAEQNQTAPKRAV